MSLRAVAEATAPGKLILAGEHAVVYGAPAIAFAVDRETRVTLRRRPGPTAVDDAPFADARLGAALSAVLPAGGIGVSIASTLPVGRGMGSSAALAIALVRAAATLDGRALTPAEEHAAGFAVEAVFHGTPSGVDHGVCGAGGCVRYRRVDGAPVFARLPVRQGIGFWVIDTGAPGDTAEMVAGVRARRPGIDAALAAIARGVDHLTALWCAGAPAAALGPLLTDNHRLLQDIGVSTPALDAAVSLALAHGAAGAKLCGAGGGGVVLALGSPNAALPAAAAAQGWSAFPVGIAPPRR